MVTEPLGDVASAAVKLHAALAAIALPAASVTPVVTVTVYVV